MDCGLLASNCIARKIQKNNNEGSQQFNSNTTPFTHSDVIAATNHKTLIDD